ncbi:hypothetical protein [Flavisolibacter ginsenosidimutans]|uniref:Uncharacterized protein n=1 Tax=Flavisolibacter ginsenosidimutans TaxID=661481 RepID=A0A5B8UK47_9BACT|nr:hypothetical protein [Flavisolibacter ginsenosidimutans]QEC56933.1 hypothetical protein FSB75_13835 [Flavisolibacter ginsenosidimutans]
MISLSNYEEYFILYMDNELDAAGKAMVETFVAQHPHLEEEFEILLSTKLPVDNLSFTGKEELLSSSMKLNAVDENLLLYIDDELPKAERKIVEEKIKADKDFALQHSLLLQTKLDGKETVSYPNKKELYRHERKVVPFGTWMRIAAAVVVLLFGTLFYLRTGEKSLPGNNGSVVAKLPTKITKPTIKQETTPVAKDVNQNNNPLKENLVMRPTDSHLPGKQEPSILKSENNDQQTAALMNGHESVDRRNEISPLSTSRFVSEQNIGDAVALNESVTHTPVTSALPVRNTDEDAGEPAVTDGDFKDTRKTPARGFFRKVSRFIERKAGIGTANADNELLIGSVALKLK